MIVVRFDSVGGASGDMLLATLVAAGASAAAIEAALRTLPIEGFTLAFQPHEDRGLTGLRALVEVAHEHHPHRRLSDIRRLIDASALSPFVKRLGTAVFVRLAGAEAAVHGTTPEHVHFHEVGAMDSILDVLGACVGLELLGAEAVSVSPLPEGRGFVATDHGVLPLPVPATAELLKGWSIVPTEESCELITPTGAALLSTWARELPAPEHTPATIVSTGYGFGSRRLAGRANCLRAMVLKTGDVTTGPDADECLVLECNLDDTVPELIGALTRKLLEQGALDVFTTPVQMKKQRPGVLLTTLARPADRERLLDLIFRESTTFGVREHLTRRTVLARRIVPVDTAYGQVRVKVGTWKGGDITRAPEHDDCVALAGKHGVPVRVVYEAAVTAAHALPRRSLI